MAATLKSVIFKCYSSEKLIALTPFTWLSPPGTHFTAESTEATQIKCLAQGRKIMMLVFEPSASVSRNLHSNHMTNVLILKTSFHEKTLDYIACVC